MIKKTLYIIASLSTIMGVVLYFANSQPTLVKLTNTVDAAQVCASTPKQTVSTPSPFRSGTKTLNIPKFDPALGTLVSVDFDLENTSYDWLNEFENLLAGTNTLSANVTNQLKIERPDTSAIFTTPLDNQTNSFTLPDFDGVLDFGGASGRTVNYTSPSYPNNSNLSTAPDLALFTGPSGAPGTLPIVARALGTFNFTGSDGTVISLINWHVTAGVVYNYCNTINPASLGDFVFNDLNANGIQDVGEGGIAGATVTLTDTSGNPVTDASGVAVGPITTPASGAYSFTNLIPGNYVVKFTMPAGYVRSGQDLGGNDNSDSDASPSTGNTGTITLVAGENNTSIDAGGYQAINVCTSTPKQSVSSVPDLFDSGLNNDQTGNLPKFDSNLGTLQSVDFSIENVFSDWDIKIENLGNAKNNLNIGITNKLGVRRPDGTLLLTTPTDIQNRNPHFTIYDGVTDFAGTSGYSELYLFPASPTTITQTTNLTSGTDLTLFTGPGGAPGTLGILFDPDTISTASGVANAIIQNPVNWHATASVVYNYCTSVIPAKLGDFVFNDTNANGIQDIGETGIAGAIVSLTDTSGNPVLDGLGVAVANITTPASGAYQFANLIPGNYIVKFTLPAGYTHSPKDIGSDTTDSDADTATGNTATITLVAGQNDIDVDAGGFQASSVGDFIWNDVNANGVQDLGETGLAGAIVSLTDSSGNPVNDISGNPVASITTPASGAYLFSNLLAGNYIVKVVLPATYKFSPLDAGGNDLTDSDTITATGLTASFALAAGQNKTDVDSGAFVPATLGDFAWNDVNANGVQDAGETGLAGVVVSLTDTSGNPVTDASGVAVANITTTATGAYLFTNLLPGNYIVNFTNPAGYAYTLKDAGGNDTKDSDADITTGKTATVTLTSGQNNLDTDAGFFQPAKLGDFVWVDTNANGVQDAGETGLAGAVVSLTDTSGNPVTDASGVAVASITTPASGAYQFTNLLPGNYIVKVVLPATYKFSPLDQGANDTKDSDTNTATGLTATITLTSGQTNSDTDSGAYIPAKLGDFIFTDTNANGIQDAGETGITGAVVSLTDSSGNPVTDASGVAVGNITTPASGFYQFTNLVPGSYIVKVVLPATYVFTKKDQGADDTKDSDTDPITGKTAAVTLTSGQTNSDLDAGALIPAKLGDFIWEDTNANGVQDAGELGLAGATVTLTDASGNPVTDASGTAVAAITTPASGFYQFTNLIPGSYIVKVTLPTNYTFTPQDAGGNDTKDSDTDTVTGKTSTITLVSGQTNADTDIGAFKVANIGDFVWKDLNHDGIQDAGEPGIDGVTVELYDSTNTKIKTTTTAGGGKYLFTGIIPGTYTVKFIAPTGYTTTLKNVTPGATDSDADTTTGITSAITIVSGVDNLDQDAGYFGYNVSGDVWVDLNLDLLHGILPTCGTADPLTVECGVPSVTVTLKDSAGLVVATTTTDTLGHYSFTNIPNGTYNIVETQPAAYSSENVNIIPVTLSGVNLTGKDFAELPASVSGFVYVDVNNDGVKDPTEVPIVGTTVKLTCTDVDGNAVAVTTTTDATGKYIVNNLRAGICSIAETQPSNYLDGKDTAGTTAGTVSNDLIDMITLPAGVNSTDNNFGEIYKGIISGHVYVDPDTSNTLNTGDTPLSGIKLTLSDGQITTTDTNGYYEFIHLPDGDYKVTETQPTLYQNGNTLTNLVVTSTTDITASIKVVADTHLNNDFTEKSLGLISGMVFYDKNKDSLITPVDDTAIKSVVINLQLCDGTAVSTTTTDTAGAFVFKNVPTGICYQVVEVQPLGYGNSLAPTNVIKVGILVDTSTGNNFGETYGSLSGKVYLDKNKSDSYDTGDGSIANVPITLAGVDANGNVISKSTTTDSNGLYSFLELPGGTYKITETQPVIWYDAADTLGSTGGNLPSNDISASIILAGGVDGVNYDFGEVGGTISGNVFSDPDKSQNQSSSESNIQQVKLTLKDSSGNILGTQTSDTDGSYKFSDLPIGDYSVEETQPSGYSSTTPDILKVSLTSSKKDILGVNYGEIQDVAVVTPPLAKTGADYTMILIGLGMMMLLVGIGLPSVDRQTNRSSKS